MIIKSIMLTIILMLITLVSCSEKEEITLGSKNPPKKFFTWSAALGPGSNPIVRSQVFIRSMGSCSASEIELKSTLDNTTACLIMTGTNKYNIDPIMPKIINIVSSSAMIFQF